MRILHVITRLIRGGAQENTVLTALHHKRSGHDVSIATGAGAAAGREGDLAALCAESSIPLLSLSALEREPSPLADARAYAQLVRLCRGHEADVVHTHTSKAGFLGRLAARATSAGAVVHTPHGHIFDAYYGPLMTSVYVLLERFAATASDLIVALTPREVSDHLARGIGHPRQFRVVPSGVDLARFAPAAASERRAVRARLGLGEEAFVIGCVGRLAPVKGQASLLDALVSLRRALPSAHVLLVGDGADRERHEAFVRSHGLERAVTFAGHATEPERYYAAFDALAVPSLNEGMGRVVIEAMAAGVPVVGTRVGGIPDLIASERTGLLVPARHPEALAAALSRLASEPGLGNALARAASSEVAPAYGVESMAARLIEVYEEALALGTRRGSGRPPTGRAA